MNANTGIAEIDDFLNGEQEPGESFFLERDPEWGDDDEDYQWFCKEAYCWMWDVGWQSPIDHPQRQPRDYR